MQRFFVSYRKPIGMLLALAIMAGLFAYARMQTALFPDITFPKIKIIADAGQQPVDKMLVTVTQPLENAIKQVPDLTNIRSTTSRGSCEISAYVSWNSNIDIGKQRIESKINEIRNALPPETEITVEKMNPSILQVIGYSMESNTMSAMDMRYLAVHTVKPFLSQVEGVSEIGVIGGKTKEYWLVLNPTKLSVLGLTPDAIGNALAQTNNIKSNGYLSDYRMMYLTITNDALVDKASIENTPIANAGGRVVRVSDVAEVQVREAKEYVKINANGREGLLIAVIKQPNANLIDVSDKMAAKVEALKDILPSTVSIKPYYVQADFVRDTIGSVRDSLWIGLLLAIVIAVIFLRSLKASVVILLTMPVTLCLTVVVLYAMGQTFNIMTLGAIAAAIGLVIDDAIVVVEQFHRSHEEHPHEPSSVLVQRAIKYLFPAMLASSLSTVVIFLPFVLMSGVAGAYFKVMTDSMIVTLVCSFLVTWLGLPVIYLMLSRNAEKENTTTKPDHDVKRRRWIYFFIAKPWLSIGFLALLVVLTVIVVPKLETGFLPEMDEGSIVVDYASPPGTSLEETDRMLREVEKLIVKTPEVEAYSRRTGTQMGFFITEPNTGDYLIQLKKNRKRSTDDVIEELRAKIEATQPALRVDFGQVIGDMLGDLMTSVQPVEVKIFGPDRLVLQDLSKQVENVVTNVKGAADVFNGIVIAGPTVSVKPDEAQLAQYGISPTNFQYQMQSALEGNLVGTLMEKEQLTNVRLLYPNSQSFGVQSLRQQQIFLPNGKLVPITNLANVSINPGQAEVQRENLQNMGVVTARLENRDLGSVMKDIKAGVLKSVHLPKGYYIAYGGAYAQQQQSFNELLMILVTASLLVFCVMLFLFKEFKVALVILLVAVCGVAGSLLALFVTGTPLNVGSYTGIIMIVGIVGENAVFTLWQFFEARQTQDVDDAIVYSISTRLRPKLMTALGAITALMPIALGIGTGAQLHQPLAIAVIGGFVVAMPLLLLVLPTFIRVIYRTRRVTL